MIALQVQTVSRTLGAWKWAKTRYYKRLVIVDTSLWHRKINHKGLLKVISKTVDVCGDYKGGRYGLDNASWIHETAESMSICLGLPVIEEDDGRPAETVSGAK